MSGHRFVSTRDLTSRYGMPDSEAPSALTASRDEIRARTFAVDPEPVADPAPEPETLAPDAVIDTRLADALAALAEREPHRD